MNYGDGAMADAVSKEKQLRNFFQTVQAETRSVVGPHWLSPALLFQPSLETALLPRASRSWLVLSY